MPDEGKLEANLAAVNPGLAGYNPYLASPERPEPGFASLHIYFEKGKPTKSEHKFAYPERFLNGNDRETIDTFLGGSEVLTYGGRADEKDTRPDRVQQLMRQHFGFVGSTDPDPYAGQTDDNRALANRRWNTVLAYMVQTLVKHDPAASLGTSSNGSGFRYEWDELAEWRQEVIENLLYARWAPKVPPVTGVQQGSEKNWVREQYARTRHTAVECRIGESLHPPVPETCSGHHSSPTEGWICNKANQPPKVRGPTETDSLGENEIEAARALPYTVADIRRALLDDVKEAHEDYQDLGGDLDRLSDVSLTIRKGISCYRFHRMALHEVFRGNWNPVVASSLRLHSGAATVAAHNLCKSRGESLACKYDVLTQSPYTGGLSNEQDADYNRALRLYHQYLVRTYPWYRAGYLSEFPGRSPPETFFNFFFTDASKGGHEEVRKWEFKTTDSWEELGRVGSLLEQNAGAIAWGDPEGEYMNELQHNLYMKQTGGYKLSEYPFQYTFRKGHGRVGERFSEVDDPNYKGAWEVEIEPDLDKDNGKYPFGQTVTKPEETSFTKQVRDAVKEAQEIVRNESHRALSAVKPGEAEEMYQAYIRYERAYRGKPDYTNRSEWDGDGGIRWGKTVMPFDETEQAKKRYPAAPY